jgi:signal transduction histidine kinase
MSVRVPAFVAEMGREDKRADIQAGIYTGYGTALAFGGIAWFAASHGLIPPSPGFAALVVAKLVTNTLSWVTLRARVATLLFASLNITADLLVMTGAVYLTGGPHSPLVPMYFIEVAVMALMTNLGLTILTVAASFVLFATMCGLVLGGALPLLPSPYDLGGRQLSAAYIVLIVSSFGVSMLAPGAYIALIVQRLRLQATALEERARDLAEASREKSQFMVNVTHELRTPLHGILGLSELLKDGVYGPVTDRQVGRLDQLDLSAKNLLELIDALLLLARAESARLDVVPVTVAIADVVERAVAAGRLMVGKKQLFIDVNLAADLPLVTTDRGKLSQILVNLLANAIKFTPEGGSVAIAARRGAAGGVEISVTDTGIGIPEAELGRVFEEFHQVDGSASRVYGGAGVGLAVVRTLSKMLGGEVRVESAVGKGSTFTLRVPIQLAAQSKTS